MKTRALALVSALSALFALAGCGSETGTSCTNLCDAEGAASCIDGRLTRCEKGADGCLRWSGPQACATGACADGSSCTSCSDLCQSEGQTECSAGQVRSCARGADGCLAWGPQQDCETGSCDGANCAGCTNTCPSGGASECADGKVRRCQAGTDGCLAWTAQEDCGDGFCASASACGVCNDTCAQEDDTQCSSGKLKTCLADANGCLSWGTATSCPSGFCASITACGVCDHACPTLNATECAGGTLKTCRANANGCRYWETTTCAAGFCSSATACGTCSNTCATGATECSAGQVRSCVADANGCRSWGSYSACASGQCASATSCSSCTDGCTAGATRCEAGALSSCAVGANGCLAWGTASSCESGVCASITACDRKPVASLSCPSTATAQSPVTLDASGSSDSDGAISTYAFAFGDGTTSAAASSSSVQHAYAAAGSYTATVTVADAFGATAQASCNIAVSAALPKVVISELLYDGVGSDVDVFAELHGPAGTDLSAYTLVGVNGADGADYRVVALSGSIPADGYFVVANPGAKASILGQADLTPTGFDFQNAPDSVQLRMGTTVVDAVGYGNFASASFAGEGRPAPATGEGKSLTRDAACTDTDDNQADFQVTTSPTPGRPFGAVNQAPTAQLSCPASGTTGQPLSFSAAGSSDPDGSIATYAFDFGDSSTPASGSASSVQHSYSSAGDFTVTLTVTDDGGASASKSCTVAVTQAVNQLPTARLACPTSGALGAALSFDGAQSSDPDGTLVAWAFDFGDGSQPVTGAASSAQHAFTATGTYTVTLTVTDDRGGSDDATCSLNVTLPDLVISADRELCGEQRLGKLTVQGGARVTCSTGNLTVHAEDILVDPASSIDLSASSAQSSGASYSYSAPVCVTYPAYTGAGGGGNRTAGGTAADTVGCRKTLEYGACLGSVCGVTFTARGALGGLARGAMDIDAPLGGAGGSGCSYCDINYGSCNASYVLAGGKGGGAMKLVASRTLVVYGSLLADGEAGKSAGNYGAGSGGGSGGSIVLVAPDVTLTGTISAQGAAGGTGGRPSASSSALANGGAGGEGWIKIGYGTRLQNTATISGTTPFLSVMPPLSFASTTHPTPGLAYNDDFAQLSVSWTAPFTGVQGYWSRFGGLTEPVNTANSNYGTAASRTMLSSEISSPGNLAFSVLASDATGAIGTLANRFPVWINRYAHTVASSSHPSSASWYPGTAIALSWTPPTGTSAASYPAFWYRLDRVSDTSPANAKAQWTRTANQQVTLTTDANGQPISGFAYYFHLVSEDTQGNLTKAASHFLVQVGSAPAKVSFFGYVKDGSGTGITGATVRLEPYAATATTDANGYFLLTGVYEGPYAVTVSKDGFSAKTTSVTVNAAASPWSTTLTP